MQENLYTTNHLTINGLILSMIWIAIHVKPRCEEKASNYYTKIGVENYYPFVKNTALLRHCVKNKSYHKYLHKNKSH